MPTVAGEALLVRGSEAVKDALSTGVDVPAQMPRALHKAVLLPVDSGAAGACLSLVTMVTADAPIPIARWREMVPPECWSGPLLASSQYLPVPGFQAGICTIPNSKFHKRW